MDVRHPKDAAGKTQCRDGRSVSVVRFRKIPEDRGSLARQVRLGLFLPSALEASRDAVTNR
ncbi:MAG TPA: hypothetical protein VI653_14915 [Steroidobacteraceae bacterium]